MVTTQPGIRARPSLITLLLGLSTCEHCEQSIHKLLEPASVLSSLLTRLPAELRKRVATALQHTHATPLVSARTVYGASPETPPDD